MPCPCFLLPCSPATRLSRAFDLNLPRTSGAHLTKARQRPRERHLEVTGPGPRWGGAGSSLTLRLELVPRQLWPPGWSDMPSPRLPCRQLIRPSDTCLHPVSDLTRHSVKREGGKDPAEIPKYKCGVQASTPDLQSQSWEGGDKRSLGFPNALENLNTQALSPRESP